MKKYEVFWCSFIIGVLSVGDHICKYDPSDTASEVAKSIILDPILITKYEGKEIPIFFKKLLECLEKSGKKELSFKDEFFRIKEV